MLPLEGVRVVEFAHMVMGPSCGLVLADLGAEVIKVEPLAGDNTRRLEAAGVGLLPGVQPQQEEPGGRPQQPEGRELVLKLLETRRRADGKFPPRRARQARLRL